MQSVDFVAVEHVSGNELLDLTGAVDFSEAKELAEKMLKQVYPELDDIEVIKIEDEEKVN